MKRERGVTLLVVLVMLVIITLLGIAAIRLSGSSMLVVGNMQARKFTENWAGQAIEQVLNNLNAFQVPTSAVTVVAPGGGSLPAGITAAVSNRTCVFSAPATGYSALATITPEDNTWEFSVTVTDSFTGSRTVMVQGARIRQLAGNCT